MAIATITQWLNDPNRTYHHGQILYKQYGKNAIARIIIDTGNQHSNYHFSYLERALLETNQTAAEKSALIIPDLIEFNTQPSQGITDKEFQALPDEIKQIRNNAKNHFNRAKFLFARIPLTENETDRLNQALQLLDDYDQNRELMAQVQTYLNLGSIPPSLIQETKTEKPVPDLTIRELIAESKNLPTYITKDKQKLKSTSDKPEAAQKLQNRIDYRIARLNQINQRLNA